MDSYLVDEGRKLHICGNNPDCPGFRVEQGEFRIKGYDGPVIECDKCGAEMQLKSGRFGKYFGCTNTNCKNTRMLLRNGEQRRRNRLRCRCRNCVASGRRSLHPARRRFGDLSGREPVSEAPGNARADDCRIEAAQSGDRS
jgi:ssDNA-binding Zn-finger/Zn-ribbon topoisomerase 1